MVPPTILISMIWLISLKFINPSFNLKKTVIFKKSGSTKYYGFSIAFQQGSSIIISDTDDGHGQLYEYSIANPGAPTTTTTTKDVKFLGSFISRSKDASFQFIWNYLDVDTKLVFYKEPNGAMTRYNAPTYRDMGTVGYGKFYMLGPYAIVENKQTVYYGEPFSDYKWGVIMRCDIISGTPCIALARHVPGGYPRDPVGRFFQIGNVYNSDGVELVTGLPNDNLFKGCLYISQLATLKNVDLNNYIGKSEGKRVENFVTFCYDKKEFTGFGFHFAIVPGETSDYDYIIVGMPFDNVNGHESGSICVVKPKMDKNGIDMVFDKEILFSGKKLSRFGYYIHNLKDIDSNGYEDVAVGAPFEEKGVLYIFYQTKIGFRPNYYSKIDQRDIAGEPVDMFGYSFDVFDTNNDGKLEVIIGGLGRVIYLAPLPQAIIRYKLTSNTNSIAYKNQPICESKGKQVNCVELNFCYYFAGKGIAENELTFAMHLTEKSLAGQQILIENINEDSGSFENTNTQTVEENVQVKKGSNDETCSTYKFILGSYLRTNTNLVFAVTMKWQEGTEEVFVNENINESVTLEIPVVQDCTTEICTPDLTLTLISSIKPKESIIDGSAFSLVATIANKYKKVTNVQAILKIPLEFDVKNLNNGAAYDLSKDKHHKLYSMNVASKLYPNSQIELSNLIQSKFAITKKKSKYTFEMVVKSGLQDYNLEDNQVTLTIPFKLESTIAVTGVSNPSTFYVSTETEKKGLEKKQMDKLNYLPFTFQILISNAGPHNSVGGIVEAHVPVALDGVQIAHVFGVKNSIKGNPALCLNLNKDKSEEKFEYPEIVKESEKPRKTKMCPKGACLKISCRFNTLIPNNNLNVVLLGVFDSKQLNKIAEFKEEHHLIVHGDTNFDSKENIIMTTKTTVSIPLFFKKQINITSLRNIPVWVYVVAAIGALILTLIISGILYKVGVYRRHRFVEVNRTLIASTRVSNAE